MNNSELIKIFHKNNGYLLSSQIYNSTFRYHLNQMVKKGEVQRVHKGLYVLTEYPRDNEMEVAAQLVPEGVFCLFTAWDYYELTTTVSYQYHIAIHRNTKLKLPPYPPVKLYYWSDAVYNLGITTINKGGDKLRMYDRERSVCDAVKFRNKTGEDIMFEVVGNYLNRLDRNLNMLMHYAEKLRVAKILEPIVKAKL